MKRVKSIIMTGIVIIIVGIFSFGIGTFSQGGAISKTVNSNIIASEFKQISELATYKYSYTDVVVIKNSSKFKEFEIPFTKNSFLAKFNGTIKAGVDLNEAKININQSQVDIQLKKSIVMANNIDMGSIFIYDEINGLFNKIQTQDKINEMFNKSKEVESELIRQGFLEQGDENCKKLINSLLNNLGFKDIIIHFN